MAGLLAAAEPAMLWASIALAAGISCTLWFLDRQAAFRAADQRAGSS